MLMRGLESLGGLGWGLLSRKTKPWDPWVALLGVLSLAH